MVIDDIFSNQLKEAGETMAALVQEASGLAEEIKSLYLKSKYDMYSDYLTDKKTDANLTVSDFRRMRQILKNFETIQGDTDLLLEKVKAYILHMKAEVEQIAGEAYTFLNDTEGGDNAERE